MEFLLDLPFYLGMLITVFFISTMCLIVVKLTQQLIGRKLTKQHEKIGRLLFRVTAGLIALLLSLSYANEKVRLNKIVDSMEVEASTIVTVSMRLNHFDSDESKAALMHIMNYVELTINDDWKVIEKDPFFSKITQSLRKAYEQILLMPTENEAEANTKEMILRDLNEIIKLTQIRIYSQTASTPYLIYILLIGLTFMWIFFTVYKVDFVSVLFLTLYNTLIAVLIYFVFSLSNPLIGPLKVKPESFILVKTKGFDMYKE